MGEIERREETSPARQRPTPKAAPKDPTEWRPRPDPDYERVENNLAATNMRSEPLHYQSLADLAPGVIAGIEANARAGLVRTMDQHGVTVDERAVRVHWQLVVEGYGFKMPEGFVHPEAPDEVKQEGRAAWKRSVEMAADSMMKAMFVLVWRRKRGVLPSAPKVIEAGAEEKH
jgi:hypothetical protein